MKRIIILIALSMSGLLLLKSQSFELGLARNYNLLSFAGWGYVDWVSRQNKSGISAYARYQNPKLFFLLKNNSIGIDYTRGAVYINEHTSPSGAGGNSLSVDYRGFSITGNNYFANFKTLKKKIQISMGLHFNYKIFTRSWAYYRIQKIGWDTLHNHYLFSYNYYGISGDNNPYFSKFNMGICLGAGTSFNWGKYKLSCRYNIDIALDDEIKIPNLDLGFSYFRQNLGLYIVRQQRSKTTSGESTNKKSRVISPGFCLN